MVPQVVLVAADLSTPDGRQQLLRQLAADSIHVSVLVANAGTNVGPPRPFWEYSAADERFMQQLNGQACYELVRALLPAMLAQGAGGGAVVAISSQASQGYGAYIAAYAAEKAKLNCLMQSLDTELYGSGVRAQAMVRGHRGRRMRRAHAVRRRVQHGSRC